MPASRAAPNPLFTHEDVNKIDANMKIACGTRCRHDDEVAGFICCWALWARVVEGVGAAGSWRVVAASIGLRNQSIFSKRVPPRSLTSSIFG